MSGCFQSEYVNFGGGDIKGGSFFIVKLFVG